jgi:hypothetical protein
MRLRAIQTVPGLDPNAGPDEGFQKFARMIAMVPKAEADKESQKEKTPKRRMQNR